jgi:beta-glucosidase
MLLLVLYFSVFFLIDRSTLAQNIAFPIYALQDGSGSTPQGGSGSPTASAARYTQTGVYFNSTGTAAYASATLYNPAAAPTPNYFDSVPPGYTSPQAPAPLNRTSLNPSPRWDAAYTKARAYLSNWTLEDKVQLATGAGWQIGRCLGNIPAIPSQNFPGLCLQDSPLGVRLADYVSAFPAGINVASTFDKDLMYARGYAMGEEFKGKGANVALGPATNMGRVAAGGRNWESFGGDPYLSGWATEMTVKGMQDAGVQAV